MLRSAKADIDFLMFLYGGYRYLQLLTGCQMTSVIRRLLLKEGVREETLKRLFELGKTVFYQTKVTKAALE